MSLVITAGYNAELCARVNHFMLALGVRRPVDVEIDETSVLELSRLYANTCAKDPLREISLRDTKRGVAWRNAAAKMVLDNAYQKSWGWAEPCNLYMMNFWREFEPDCKIILVYMSPAEAIGRWMQDAASRDNGAIDLEVANWKAYHATLRDVYRRHPENTILINIDALADHETAAKLISDKLNLGLDYIHPSPNITKDHFPALLELVAERLIEYDSEIVTISEWLKSSDILRVSGTSPATQREQALAAFKDYGNMVWKEELDSLHNEYATQIARAEALEVRVSRSEAMVEEVSKDLSAKMVELESSNSICNSLGKELGQKEALLKSEKQMLSTARIEEDRLRNLLLQKTSELEARQETIRQLGSDLTATESRLAAKQRDLDTLLQDMQAHEQRLIETDERLNEANTNTMLLSQELKASVALTNKRDMQISDLSEQLAALHKVIDETNRNVTTVEAEKVAMSDELSLVRERSTSAEDRLLQTEEELRAAQALSLERDMQISDLRDRMNDLEAQRSKDRAQIREDAIEMETMQIHFETALTQLEKSLVSEEEMRCELMSIKQGVSVDHQVEHGPNGKLDTTNNCLEDGVTE